MIAQVISVEQNKEVTTKNNKEIVVTQFIYQSPPFQGKSRPPTVRNLFDSLPAHPDIIQLNKGQWVEITFDKTQYKNIETVKVVPAPGGPTQVTVNNSSGEESSSGEQQLWPQGTTPKSRCIAIEACLKCAAMGLPEFNSTKDMFAEAKGLYYMVIDFANEPITYKGCATKKTIAELKALLEPEVPELPMFFEWLANRPNMDYLWETDGTINLRLLTKSHAEYIIETIDKIISDFNASGEPIAPTPDNQSTENGNHSEVAPPPTEEPPPF